MSPVPIAPFPSSLAAIGLDGVREGGGKGLAPSAMASRDAQPRMHLDARQALRGIASLKTPPGLFNALY
jgi:hypothetical protein